MIASVIVCTYNRSRLLAATIESLISQEFNGKWELIVVDNNSTDDTKLVVESFIYKMTNIRYVFESNQGHSFARNAGITSSTAKYIVFTDDDIFAEPNWLKEIILTFDEDKVVAVGGPIKPVWPFNRPEWLNKDWMLEPLAVNEFNDAREKGYFVGYYPYGANMAFRREVFNQCGLFATDLGRKRKKLLTNDDVEIMMRISESGQFIKFAANAVIHHKIDPERLTKHWYYRRFYWQGRSDAIIDKRHGGFDKKRICDFVKMWASADYPYMKIGFEERCRLNLARGYLHQIILGDDIQLTRSERQQMYFIELLINVWRKDRKEMINCPNNIGIDNSKHNVKSVFSKLLKLK